VVKYRWAKKRGIIVAVVLIKIKSVWKEELCDVKVERAQVEN